MTEADNALVSVEEAAQMMRAAGFEIGSAFLMEGIKQGVFPFAFAIVGKQYRYYISRRKLTAYLKEWCGR